MSQIVRVGLVQHPCSRDREENLDIAARGIREAAERGATVVCLQELFASQYFCQVQTANAFALSEDADGPTLKRMTALAAELRVTILTSLFERAAPGVCFNTLVALGPNGTTLGKYRKMHIPQDPQFEEKFYFTPGDLGFIAVPLPQCTVGLLICWDQWFPEAARLTAMRGAQILFYPTAIGWLPTEKEELGQKQLDAWLTMQRSHAIANGVFTVGVNRCGTERSSAGEIEFWGNSFVCGPDGALLCSAGENATVQVAECDLDAIATARETWPFFRDRRVDRYQGLLDRWHQS